MEIEIPLSLMELSDPPGFYFQWEDNIQQPDDIQEFFAPFFLGL